MCTWEHLGVTLNVATCSLRDGQGGVYITFISWATLSLHSSALGTQRSGQAIGQGWGAISSQLACTRVLLPQLTYKLCDKSSLSFMCKMRIITGPTEWGLRVLKYR